MQPAIILSISSLALAVMLSVAMGGRTNPELRTQALQQETETYFDNIASVVVNEITPARLQAMQPADDFEDFLQQTAIRQLAPGPWGNPLLDAWGNPVRVAIAREQIALSSQVTVPVTGIVLISAGSDRVFQTTPGNPTTLAALQGILPPLGSDDLVTYFTDEEAQRVNLVKLQRHVEAVAAAMLRDYKISFSSYVQTLQANYQNALRQNPMAPAPNVESLLLNDPSAPRFADLSNTTERSRLGVSDHINTIEQIWPDGGRFRLEAQSTDLRQDVTLRVVNQPGATTPWGTVNLSFLLEGGI